MDIFFKDNLNSSDQLYIEQLLCASTAASTDNTGSWGITPALIDILDADGWWFAASDPDLISKSCPVSKTYLSGCMAVYQTGDDSFECVPFVYPDLRKKGIFSQSEKITYSDFLADFTLPASPLNAIFRYIQ